MKVYDVITESRVDEIGGIVDKGLARLGNKQAATNVDMRREAELMKKEFKIYFKSKGGKKGQVTIDDLESYLDQKGLGGVANDAIQAIRQDKAARDQAKQDKIQAVGFAASKAAGAVGSAAKNVAAKVKKGLDTPDHLKGALPPDKTRTVTNSMYEDVDQMPLTNQEVDQVIWKAIQAGYGKNARFSKSKFSSPAGSAPASEPQDQDMIKALQAKGYTVTKKAG